MKVFNKFDRSIYAVKIVHFTDKQSNKQVLREVELLSKLNHPNVVRYYSSWLDDYDSVHSTASDSSEDTNTNTNTTTNNSNNNNSYSNDSFPTEESSFHAPINAEDDLEIVFEDSNNNNNSSENVQCVDESFNTSKESTEKSEESSEDTLNEETLSEKTLNAKKCIAKGPVLCIQMELCKEKTLKDLIINEEIKDKEMCYNIFRDIVSALAYIHENKIMHRDLKPNNIFVGLNSQIKLGDFGLSRATSANKSTLDELESGTFNSEHKSSDLTLNIGTMSYMAPELKNKKTENYTDKVDIYSLGLIFLEMCANFKTVFEKMNVFKSLLETGELPKDIANNLEPIELQLISGMCQLDVNKRFSANDILQMPLIQMSFNESNIKNYDTNSLINILAKDSDLLRKFLRSIIINSSEAKMTLKFPDYFTHSSFNLSQFIFQSISLFYCAINFAELSLFPISWWHKINENNIANVVDSKGQFLSLPHFTKYPFAFQVSNDSSKYFLRRIFIGPAYIDAKTDYFKEYSNANFDIVWPKIYSSSTLISYIEVYSFAIDLLLFFIAPAKESTSTTNSEFYINNSSKFIFNSNTRIIFTMNNLKLLAYICEILEIPLKDYGILIKHIIFFNQNSSSNRNLKEYIQHIKNSEIFLNDISEQKINILFELLNISTNSVDIFIERISSILDRIGNISKSSEKNIQSQFDYLRMLTSSIEYYFKLKNSTIKFSEYFGYRFSLSSIKQNFQFYNGIITYFSFERKNDPNILLAVAGTYSHLIKEEIINSDNFNQLSKCSIGISFNLSHLNEIKLANHARYEYLVADKFIRLLTNRFRTIETGNVNFKFSFTDVFVVPVFNQLNLNSINTTLNFVYQLRELGISVLLTPERIITEDFIPKESGPTELIFDAAKNQFSKLVIFIEIMNGNLKFHCFNQLSPRHSGKNSGWESKTLTEITEVIEYVLDILKYGKRSSVSPQNLQRSSSVQNFNYQIEFINSSKFDRRKLYPLVEKQVKNYFTNNQNMFVLAVDYPYEIIKLITFHFDIDKLVERLKNTKNIMAETKLIEQELLKELARINGFKHYLDSITRTVKSICNYIVNFGKNGSQNNLMILLMAINEHYKFSIIT